MAIVLEEAPLERLCRDEELEERRNQQLIAQETEGGSVEGVVQQQEEEHHEATLNNNIGDAPSSEEVTCGDINSGSSDYERSHKQRSERQKRRKRKAGIEDDDDFVNARIPKNLLSRLSMLGAKLDVSLRCHLAYTMAFYEVCGNNISPDCTAPLVNTTRVGQSRTFIRRNFRCRHVLPGFGFVTLGLNRLAPPTKNAEFV